ncbi:histidine acid phosphatase family protein [Stylonychia lemnae]|uniref:Histidine acid phosphatase family protein n=1 Tax=Stylonychia lemnae TaxID=5949 RepID=A0A078AVV5_STYLE|nr:histidine acid phosphatase family protein [Stylonychia lemnae]|eukprot:CDW86221.1 histidine acid phosphatase family protein [Stylonychia lemnae]
MKHIQAFVSAALLFGVSQAAKELEFIAEIGTHGHSYFPLQSRFKHMIQTDEPIEDYTYKNITPLGIRQQYLIGQELRRRYVTNLTAGTEIEGYSTPFLNYSYRIQEMFMRTAGNSQSYISANAQMIGLYPPETCNQRLTEWQKKNVRPPLFEGISDEEVEALGDFATKGGFTPFDIFNQYQTEDQMNDYNGLGCKRYSQLRELSHQSEEFETIKNNLTQQYLQYLSDHTSEPIKTYDDALELCQFIYDAWIDGYDFSKFEYDDKLKNVCQKFMESQAYYKLYAHKDLRILKISELSQLLTARLYALVDQEEFQSDKELDAEYKWLLSVHQYQMKFNNFNKIIEFKMFMFLGESWNVKAFLSIVSDQFKFDFISPSSLIILEVYDEESENEQGVKVQKASVKVKYNDELVTLNGRCLGKTECDIFDFIQTLRDQGQILSKNMRDVCGQEISKSDTFEFESPSEILNYLNSY